MKIASASIEMQSSHAALTRHEEQQSLRAWVGARPDFEGTAAARLPAPPPPVQISSAGKAAVASDPATTDAIDDPASHDPFVLLIKSLLEWLMGQPIKLFDARELQAAAGAAAPAAATTPPEGTPAAAPAGAGWGIEFDARSITEESERTDFSAQGKLRTADGRDIGFSLSFAMARQWREETSVSVRAGDGVRKDPLVINFGGTAAQLSNLRFKFDLDGDGRAENLPLLAKGSAYLALDLNGNGKVDSGAELFGPAAGSGFAALAKYDDDGNGWIDENDRVFNQLQTWTPAADGAGTLSPLAAHGVGALSLGHATTPFELRGPGNEDLGAVRATGVYLTEAGNAGSVQEIDLTV